MKKVRFESPLKNLKFNKMEERECHSPRPFTQRQVLANAPDIYSYPKVVPYSNDPIQLFECSNSSPYPTMDKTNFSNHVKGPQWSPCNDLELSMLDATNNEPRKPTLTRSILKPCVENILCNESNSNERRSMGQSKSPLPSAGFKMGRTPPNVLMKDDDFFIKRDNLGKINIEMNPMQQQFNRLSLDKENDPLMKKSQIAYMKALPQMDNQPVKQVIATNGFNNSIINNYNDSLCRCHHCIKKLTPNLKMRNTEQVTYQNNGHCSTHYTNHKTLIQGHCMCGLPPPPSRCCNHAPLIQQDTCKTSENECCSTQKINAVDKKTWAIEKYEQSKKSDTMEVEKQTNILKEKREPTVADLFKIIKLQNEQLQLLQEKVDKFISASQQQHNVPAHQNCMSEHVAIESVDKEQHKISIGVMTSFEMVRTSTIINKEVLKTNDNAQIQCNRSQISIKEVQSQSPNSNFLDGIAPVLNSLPESACQAGGMAQVVSQPMNEEKTFNELSLYNVQVDNATTPLMSPEQTLYLDVRDYSDSDAESDDRSNVGWTYYNKVMTHVNGMLQDSDMPSSASALYRNTRQQLQTVQMQIDKTNISVTKRVKFGDDPLGIHQPHIYAGSTDTSLKMNQLAAKYLKGATSIPVQAPQRPPPAPITAPIDMSFATRNYMERHKLIQGDPASTNKPRTPTEMPRFLDITALKQQPKYL